MLFNRRQFSAASLASVAFAGAARATQAQPGVTYRNQIAGYGPLLPDPGGLLDLPKGFRYKVLAKAGQPMEDGYIVPDKFDGMGCFSLSEGRLALVRNHELKPVDQELGPIAGLARLGRRLAS